ncbi:MAG: cupin [Moraxellaceae bacterium]|nr:MAG: cupin [Moraxellaceae bacterium]
MKPLCRVLSSKGTFMAKTGLPYRFGLTAESVGATGLSMHVITIPPGGRAMAHKHEGHESMLFLMSGEAETFSGDDLSERVILKAGDLQYIPAGCAHLSINLSQTESCVGVVARTDPNEQESVVMLPELDTLVG